MTARGFGRLLDPHAVKRVGRDGEPLTHLVEQDLEETFPLFHAQPGEQRILGELFIVARKIIKPREAGSDQAHFLEVGIGISPTSPKIRPQSVCKDFGKGLLGLLAIGISFNVRVEHPIAKAGGLLKIKAKRFAHRFAKLGWRQALGTCIANRPQDGSSQQRYKDKIVEVTRLKRCILPVVCKAEQLAGMFVYRAVPLHPRQNRGNNQGRRRASPFGGKTGKLVDLTGLLGGLMPAVGTKAVFTPEKPAENSLVVKGAIAPELQQYTFVFTPVGRF